MSSTPVAESKYPAPVIQGEAARARAFAAPLLAGQRSLAGEDRLEHADGVLAILEGLDADAEVRAAAYLSQAAAQLNHPDEVLTKAFGAPVARLAQETLRMELVQARSRALPQAETVRRMLLAFSRDARVVLLRLASRLQTLRWNAAQGVAMEPALAQETAQVFVPLAGRLGIWQIKWEMEDLVLREQEPDVYHDIARKLGVKRREREAEMAERRTEIQAALRAQGISAVVSGRPKHISSIVRKMRGKNLSFEQVRDVRALRVIVPTVDDCYATLGWLQQHYTAVPGEFDDYIARPKPNGYQSLHVVVRDAEDKVWEIQIRTRAMHDTAEHGVAAHWVYKEAGTRGYAGVSANSSYDIKIAMLRRLLAWGSEMAQGDGIHTPFDDRIYVLTPDARIIELPAGATPVDFAYAVHTELGHRCRGARVDGAMAPLHTQLRSGQTVEITAAKEGGPSRDWLNPELHFLASS
ncbi:MAG: bifunctional (p)ppGpp synthetase/guanosine-3',5'-bis(diphosphate) 3'-pyrophosphohydrolase, partial [Ottowia sp.]|nr:bifunctional (p)ppGpp synthetase/guanosine-3',5'-bis(diphosphate) 3'-pyrophosphohydrolase [Ottowia sp.]